MHGKKGRKEGRGKKEMGSRGGGRGVWGAKFRSLIVSSHMAKTKFEVKPYHLPELMVTVRV